MRAMSLFANIGVAEAYLEKIGVNVVLANELVERRARLYSTIYPDTEMICGDITNESIYQELKNKAIQKGVETIIATPPCQGFSRAYRNQDEHDMRNLLIAPVVRMILDINPKYVFIENVPQLIEKTIYIEGDEILIPDYLKKYLGGLYSLSFYQIDTKDYSVPQSRHRTIILMTRLDQIKKWVLPDPDKSIVTLEDAIGDLPSLDPFVKDIDTLAFQKLFPDYEIKRIKGMKVSKWHLPPVHIERQVITMMHTPTGKTAFDNDKYIPQKADGTTVTGYKSTYRRLRWGDPASTVTMDNRKISSQNNVHPGRYLGIDEDGDVLYSDPRVLTLFELMRVMSLPDDWALPNDINIAFVRSVIGEGIPPLFVKKVFENIV